MQGSGMIEAKLLRRKEELTKIQRACPGYYKWWCGRKELDTILSRLEIQFDDVCRYLETNDDKFCIYVGVAIKESVRARLNWHVNQENTHDAVDSGALSTLRQTISSIVAGDMSATRATNDFIDKLWVEYFLSANKIGSQEARDEIHPIEQNWLNGRNLYVLNIQENRHPLSPRKKLRALRREAKQRALGNF